jgi:ubiquinone/menaquinone biosynthesis C-methylase UbiE
MFGRSVNHWPDSKCAKAFWNQRRILPYQELLSDTVAWLEPEAGERWLDLGCGCGQLSQALWQASGGTLAEIVGLDVAEVNARAYEKLRASLQPSPGDRLKFVAADFSHGLARWPDAYFDGVASGLAIQYAESYSEAERRWTRAAYDRVLADVARVLKPTGRFVFSVNVPEPAWGAVARATLRGAYRAKRPHSFLLRAWRIYRYGGWLKREARRGRFHYLPLPDILRRLQVAGFAGAQHRMSFARQAYVIRAPLAA